MATELSDGKLMFNSRNQKGDIRARIVCISSNGGQTWDTTYFDKIFLTLFARQASLQLEKEDEKHTGLL